MNDSAQKSLTKHQKLLITGILLSAFLGVAVSFLRSEGIGNSALLYIGLPTIIALAFAKTSKAKSVTGSTLKAITFIILISGPVLQEGFICMVMAAPIFYMVGALVAIPIDVYKRRKEKGSNPSKLSITVLPCLLLIMSMEGVLDETTFDRHNSVQFTKIIDRNAQDIMAVLGNDRPIGIPDSLFTRLFPRPEIIHADGVAIGDKHWVELSYFKWVYWNELRGVTEFTVAEKNSNRIVFNISEDTAYIGNYLTWKTATVDILPISHSQTQVTWTINFQRDIDPFWYAEPLQRYAVRSVAKLFVESLQ